MRTAFPCKQRVCGAAVVLAPFLTIAAALVGGCTGAAPRDSNAAAPREAPAPGSSDPDQLLVAALRAKSVDNDPALAVRFAERAATAAPTRPDVAWVHLRLCSESPGCEVRPLEVRLRKLAPGNATVWLGPLGRAESEGDAQAEAQILNEMGRSSAFNVYWTTLVFRMTTALHAAAPPRIGVDAAAPLTAAMNDVTGWLSAIALPAFAPINSACNAQRLQDPVRRAACQRVSQVLTAGDTFIAEGVGVGIAQRLASPGTVAANDVEGRINTLAYQNQAAGSIMAAQVERDKFTDQVLKLMQKLPREQDVRLAILRWAGRPTTP